jgi:RNA-directed DNA polymerase
MDRSVLTQWLSVGFVHENQWFPTEEGTSQGGIASPTLANVTLDGMEQWVKSQATKSDKVHFIRYADDFIITCSSKELLEDKIKPAVKTFLAMRGLTLSDEKTKITHIDKGFDFLGFNIRKYNGKLLIKPSRKSVKSFLANIRDTIKSNKGAATINLIGILNPKIRGWANYYRHAVSKQTFSYVDTTSSLQFGNGAYADIPQKVVDGLKRNILNPPTTVTGPSRRRRNNQAVSARL